MTNQAAYKCTINVHGDDVTEQSSMVSKRVGKVSVETNAKH
jgi:hypothetical protein